MKKPPDGGEALGVEDIASRATSYHATQIRGKVSVHDDDTGSHGRVLNKVCTEGHGSSAGKADVDNDAVAEEMAAGPRTVTPARRTVTTATVVLTRTGTHTEENSAGNAQGARGRGRGNQASSRNPKGRCRCCYNSTEHGWQNSTLRLSHEAEDAKE